MGAALSALLRVKSTPAIGVPIAAELGTETYGVVGGGVPTDSTCTDLVRACIDDKLNATHGFQKQREEKLGVKESLLC